MIKNDRQYEVTMKQLARLKDAKIIAVESGNELPKLVFKSTLAGLDSQINELEESINEYGKLRKD